jgi:heme oxygenase
MEDYHKALDQIVARMDEYKKTEEYTKAMERLSKIDWKKEVEEYNKLMPNEESKLKTIW